MAVAVRTVAAWRVVSNAMATSSVRCGVEPTRKVQQVVLPRRSAAAAQLLMSSSGDGAQLRCQAATLTAVRREFATADGVFEREVEMRCLEESRAALRGSFEAVSVSGRAECVGTEECRPVLDEARLLPIAGAPVDMAAEASEQSRMYYGRRGGGDAYMGMATSTKRADTEEDVQMGRSEMVAAFDAALQGAGRNAEMLAGLAMRAWRKLGDADRAEQLYMEALQLAPQDSAIQASYAQFLWHCDA